MMNYNDLIIKEIEFLVKKSERNTKYRKPLIGFADSKNCAFRGLKDIISSNHLLPYDLLPEASSVVSFFLPFTEELVSINEKHSYVSEEWAIACIETNELINEIINYIGESLKGHGVMCSNNPASEYFDKQKLVHRWSQRHVAKICGLGNFGINNMLITELGCAGRYGSFVIDMPLIYNDSCTEEFCLYKKNGSCMVCIESCPTGALAVNEFDRYKCYAWLKEVSSPYNCDVCGKCITIPCAFKKP